MKPRFFRNQLDFRKWLEKNHTLEKELVVGYWKVGTGKPSMSWSESVDQALCFGWIDGIRRGIDIESYSIRFTPRKPTSIWSRINIAKMEDLLSKDLVFPAGKAAYSKRNPEKSAIYSFETGEKELPSVFLKKFKARKQAWTWFNLQSPSYRKAALHWVMSAKREETKSARLDALIQDSGEKRKIKPLSY